MKKLYIGRIIGFMLAILLVFNTVIITGAAEENLTREVEFLKYFGVLEDALDDETLSAQVKVTRADFAQYFSRLMNMSASNLTELYYYDVPQTYYAYEEITILTKTGYMSGVGNKLFEPEEIMQMEYCYAIFLKAIGLAEAVNGDVNEMQALCMTTGLLKGVNQLTGELTMPNLVKMLYNALFAECYESNGIAVVKGDDILFSITRNMEYVQRGRVESVNGISLDEKAVDEDVVKIGGKKYIEPSFDIENLLGRDVRFVYERPGKDDINEGRIIWIEGIDSSDVLELSVDPDCNYDKASGTLKYIAENGKVDKVQIPSNITMIYNGKFKGTGIASVLGSDRYEITLIKGNSNSYTTAIVWQYRNVVVKSINSAGEKVYGKNSADYLNLNSMDYDKLEIINVAGEYVEFEDIKIGDVLSIYESDDKKYCRVRVTNNTLTGKVTSIKKYEISVGEETVELYDRNLSFKNQLGKNIKFYRDVMGLVADFEQILSGGEITVGFMIDAVYVQDSFSGRTKLKIFDESGKFAEYDIADKVKANGTRYTSEGDKVYDLFCDENDRVKSQLVAYKLNSSSEITEISTAFEDDGNEHMLMVNKKLEKASETQGPYDYAYYTAAGGRLGKNMAIDENTKFIIVPSDETVKSSPEKFFRVGAIKVGVYPDAISYRITTEPTFFEQYVLIRENAQSGEESDYAAMFDYVYQTIDEEGDVIDRAVFYKHDGNTMDVAIDEDILSKVKGFKRGDILTYTVSEASGDLLDANIVAGKNVNSVASEYRIVFGYASSIAPEGIMLGYETGAHNDEILNMKTSKVNSVIIYDKEDDEIYIGKSSDLKAYDVYRDECSRIVAGFTYNRLLYVFATE